MPNKEVAAKVLSLIDLTNLNDDCTTADIDKLCQQAVTPKGRVAAICVYSQFVKQGSDLLKGTGVNIATVVNFPGGDQELEAVLAETKQAIADGANEIDLVIPYKEYLAGNTETTKAVVAACKNVCGPNVHLKVILETGALLKPELITAASNDVIASGGDFLKTSTGKIEIGATLEAAELMLKAIKASGKNIGFKAAGGVKTVEDAQKYLDLAANIMGENWATPETFRFGASSLLGDVLTCLS